MDHYRYFMFNQRSMVVLGILQIACTAVVVVCGFMDGAFQKDSTMAKTRAPVWGGMVMAVPGVLGLCSSQRKNPVLVHSLIASCVCSCFSALIIIVYASITLAYGEDEVFSHTPEHALHTEFILNQILEGANIAMLVASFFSLCVVLCITFIGCRSLPCCIRYDHVTGMEWLRPEHEQSQTVELVCTYWGNDRVFSSPVLFTEANMDTEEPSSHLPPYVRLS